MTWEMLGKKNLEKINNNPYPGRGIVLGMTPDGQKMMEAYWLMGRSENSRNRVFEQEPDGIRTKAHDPAKMTDPELIIYWPARQIGTFHLLTNGDQTDTLYRMMGEGVSFEDALMTREFEPDAPNHTPRISGMIDLSDVNGGYRLSILKTWNGSSERCERCFYRYDRAIPGYGHCIHTYEGDGNPLPSFSGEPYLVPLGAVARETAEHMWALLNRENRVSLFARTLDRESGAVETCIINRHGA